jgi:hypothetical protein
MKMTLTWILALGLFSFQVSTAEQPGDLPIDQISTQAIKAATTDPMFLTDWVSKIPDHPIIPSPRDFLGYAIGTPGELTQVEQIHGYFRELEKASKRIRIFSLGNTHEGRDMLLAAIADENTLEHLDVYKGYLKALSDPRKTDEKQAAILVEKAKPVYWITAGLHSVELGPPEMVMELAYRLIVETRRPFANIRNQVITLITPVMDVDGRARQVDWYRSNIKGHTDYDDMPPASSPFWGHYAYHDNNRDGIAISQPLTRNYVNCFLEWLPTVSLDLHESVPLLYVAGGTGPYNPNINSVTTTEWHTLANYEISRLTGMGLKGVWTWGFYTGWYPGYLLWVSNNHNSMGRFYETFSNGSAETMERDLKGSKFAGKDVLSRQWYRTSPPPRKFTWSMRNNTNYMQTGVLASLEMVAHNGPIFLENFYKKGVNSLNAGIEKPPYAFVIPKEQTDRRSANHLLNVLRMQGIELHLSDKSQGYGKTDVEKGDVLVKLDQLYGALAKNLLEIQRFPKQDAEVPPYDDVAWTMGLMLGVTVHAVADKDILSHPSTLLDRDTTFLLPEKLPRGGRVWVIGNHGQQALGPVRFALGDERVLVAEEAFESGKETYPAGSLLFDLEKNDREKLSQVLGESLLKVTSLKKLPEVKTHELDLPRLAVLHTWTDTQNAGWVRYSFDVADIPYTLLEKERLRKGNLREDFDVILMPSPGGRTSLAQLISGIDKKWAPLPYKTTQETPNLGHILSSEDVTGGFGFEGMAALEEFVTSGGTLITLGAGGMIVTDTGIIHKVSATKPPELNTPGSILTAKVTDATSPLTYGYGALTHVFRGNGPVYSVSDQHRYLVVLQFGTKDVTKTPQELEEEALTKEEDDEGKANKEKEPPLVQSGGIISGEEIIDGAPALVSVALGKGRVVMFSWNPMHRHVNLHDHAFVYNAILNWNDLPVPQKESANDSPLGKAP